MSKKRDQSGFGHLLLILFVAIIAVVCFVGWRVFNNSNGKHSRFSSSSSTGSSNSSSAAVNAGMQLGGNNCSGSGPGKLTHSALDASSFTFMIPLGLMVGGHVTPIDHLYYSVNPGSARDAYSVYAMGDAKLVDIEHRTSTQGDNDYVKTHTINEYRLVFSQSCTFFYYYDLLTSLAPNIQSAFDKAQQNNDARLNIDVKAGDVVGRIGGQTLDYAVWNTEKPLPGFVLPNHYQQEAWKIYVADPLPYYSTDLKNFMLSRYPRTDQPLSGKIDWDIDGKLRGNWFVAGTDYKQTSGDPWGNQLSFSPNLYDPSHFVISIGNYGPGPESGIDAQQFYAKGNAPDPANVSPSSGLVKYELVTGSYITPSGADWDETTFVKGPKVKEDDSNVYGTALVQMTDGRTLKFESFPNKTAAQVSGFDSGVKTYTR